MSDAFLISSLVNYLPISLTVPSRKDLATAPCFIGDFLSFDGDSNCKELLPFTVENGS